MCRGQLRGTMLPNGPASFVFGMENQAPQCPCHGCEFDLETAAPLCGGNSRLTLYPVTMQRGSIFVERR